MNNFDLEKSKKELSESNINIEPGNYALKNGNFSLVYIGNISTNSMHLVSNASPQSEYVPIGNSGRKGRFMKTKLGDDFLEVI